MLEELRNLNQNYFQKYFNEELEIGIGAHLGKVATGDLLLGNHPHQIVMGYAVNVASRIQNLTKKFNNNFIVSEDVYLLLDHPPSATSATSKLKGVQSPYTLYLIGESFNYMKKKNQQTDG